MSASTAERATRPSRRTTPVGRAPGGRSELRTALVFIAPALLGFVVFYLYPTIRGFYFSMTQYNILGTPKWIGFDNFARIGKDPLFWNALWVTIEYVALNIGFQTVIALVLAVLMQRLTTSTVLRGALLLPWLISNVIAAMVWFWLLDYQIGLVNQFLVDRPEQDRLLRRRVLGHPDDRVRERLAAHGLHRAAGLRRPADHPALRL